MQALGEGLLPQESKDGPDDGSGDEVAGSHAGDEQPRLAQELFRRFRAHEMKAHGDGETWKH